LINKGNAYALKFAPVRELANIEGDVQSFMDSAKVETPLFKVSFDVASSEDAFALSLSNDKGERVVVSLENGVLSFDRRSSGLTSFHKAFPAIHRADMHDVVFQRVDVYVDVASVEIFVNDGERVLTEILFPTKPYDRITLKKNDARFTSVSISPIWE
jgi:fructan beta-fructosidase